MCSATVLFIVDNRVFKVSTNSDRALTHCKSVTEVTGPSAVSKHLKIKRLDVSLGAPRVSL
jgi:hypothetical protein